MKPEKKFLAIYLTAVILSLIAISAFNFIIDPLNVFKNTLHESNEVRLAKLLSMHENVLVTNMDERAFIRARVELESVEFAPYAIVVGSSRVMQIGNNIFNHNVLNLGVSGASLEDLVAILGISTKKFNPKLLLIGVDPWIFNDASGQDRWQTLHNEYNDALIELGFRPIRDVPNPISKYKELIGFGYTKQSLNYFFKKIIQSNEEILDFIDSDAPLNDRDIIRKDGSRVYNLRYTNQSKNSVNRASDDWGDNSKGEYLFSDVRLAVFKSLIRKYKKNYRVILVLSPYHPDFYNKLVHHRPVLSIERQIHLIARDENVDVIGSYDPQKTNCSYLNFYDSAHPKDSCMSNVMKEFVESRSR